MAGSIDRSEKRLLEIQARLGEIAQLSGAKIYDTDRLFGLLAAVAALNAVLLDLVQNATAVRK